MTHDDERWDARVTLPYAEIVRATLEEQLGRPLRTEPRRWDRLLRMTVLPMQVQSVGEHGRRQWRFCRCCWRVFRSLPGRKRQQFCTNMCGEYAHAWRMREHAVRSMWHDTRPYVRIWAGAHGIPRGMRRMGAAVWRWRVQWRIFWLSRHKGYPLFHQRSCPARAWLRIRRTIRDCLADVMRGAVQ